MMAARTPHTLPIPRRPSQDSVSSGHSQGGNSIRDLEYFFDNFTSTEQVAEFIRKRSGNIPGHFLLRPSVRRPNCLTLSVLVADLSVRHMNVVMDVHGSNRRFYLVQETIFSSVAELVVHYSRFPVKNLEGVDDVKFLYPITRRQSHGSQSSLSSLTNGHGNASSVDPYILSQSLPGNHVDRPPLPARPVADRQRSNSMNHSSSGSGLATTPTSLPQGHGSFDSGNALARIADRPPAPLPPEALRNAQAAGSNSGAEYTYSRARDTSQDISETLKNVLKMTEKCDCGIPRDLAELAAGWTVHRSKDPETYGKLFYQSAEGQTAWKLPAEVDRQLTGRQRANLKRLEFSTNRPATDMFLSDTSDSGTGASNTQF